MPSKAGFGLGAVPRTAVAALAVVAVVVGSWGGGAAGTRFPAASGTPAARPCEPGTPAVPGTPGPGASPPVCAAPAAVGQPVPYGEDWTLTVTGIEPVEDPGLSPAGGFLRVGLVLVNGGTERRPFPHGDLRLRDGRGRVLEPDGLAATLGGDRPTRRFAPGVPAESGVVFDVPPDAGSSFVLESAADPALRIRLDLPAAAAPATPAPAAAMGEPVPYADGWSVVVVAAGTVTVPRVVPVGAFLRVDLTVTNNAARSRAFRGDQLRLRDDQGRILAVDSLASIAGGAPVRLVLAPGETAALPVLFDVAIDAGPGFLLESDADPMFRVRVERARSG